MPCTHQPEPFGADLARAALLAARKAAKNTPAPQRKKTGPGRRTTRTVGDPVGLGAAITRLMGDRGWEPPEPGGSIIDQWPTIAPELAGKVTAERFEHDTGTLHLRPVSPAYGTQLRMNQAQILHRIQERTGSRSVRALRILAPGTTAPPAQVLEQPAPPIADAPVRTRADGCPGYQDARAIAAEHRPNPQPTNPYILEAIARQEAALRAGRPADTEHLNAEEKVGPAPGSVEASLARARAYARQQRRAGDPQTAFNAT